MSFPSWERGLKHAAVNDTAHGPADVPLVGTWIETHGQDTQIIALRLVVPLVGTWIETKNAGEQVHKIVTVVPLVGTWIETRLLIFA